MKERVIDIPLVDLHAFPGNPFAVREDAELTESVRDYGVISPLVVRPIDDGGYEIISGHRICRISKRSARYLIQNGIIPSTDNGQKTWKYRIKIDDVITYLRRREQVGSMIPCGAVRSRRNLSNKPRRSFSQYISRGEEKQVAEYFQYIYTDYPDVLTLADVAEMTGLAKETLRRFIRAGHLEPLAITTKHHIPKKTLLSFVASSRFIDYKSNSVSFKKVIGGFAIWKAVR